MNYRQRKYKYRNHGGLQNSAPVACMGKVRMEMKFFKTVDEKLAKIGFVKVEEDQYGCVYERKNKKYGYTQEIAILHKKSRRHILQSYDPDLGDSKGIGNTCVGLTGYELKLLLKKMKKLKMYAGKEDTKC